MKSIRHSNFNPRTSFIVLLLVLLSARLTYAQSPEAIENYRIGLERFKMNDFAGASQYFASSFNAFNHTMTAYMLGCSFTKLQDYEKAAEYANYAINNNPRLEARYLNVARDIVS